MAAPAASSAPCAAHAAALLRALARLDRRLEAVVATMRAAHAPEADPYRGLYVSPDDAARLAARPPGADADYAADGDGDSDIASEIADDEDGARWAHLRSAAGLTPLDAGLLLVAMAPELDLKYERLYAFLQDDVTRRRPTVDLALGLLCPSWEARVAGRARLAASAPLLRHRLLRLAADPAHPDPPLLSRWLRPEPRVVDFLLGGDELDEVLLGICAAVEPAARLGDLHLPEPLREALAAIVRGAGERGSVLLHLRGPYGVGKRTTAEALCRERGIPLLTVDVERLLAADDPEAAIGAAAREGLLRGAALLWEGWDLLLPDDRGRLRSAVLRAASDGPVAFLAGEEAWEPVDAPRGLECVPVRLERPAYPERVGLWRAQLNGDAPAPGELEDLANRFRLSGGQIRDAATTARSLARVREPAAPRVSAADLEAACRLRGNPRLAALAAKVETSQGWDDLVLPADRTEQLREVVRSMRHRARVYHEWGFGRKLALGKGLNVLFTGPPGTGKTMAAGIVAGALGLDLYRIDLSMMVSKYIGETEKNLARVFAEAETSNAILFFDEADALFGRRSEVRDSHDRYANLEVAYLLQRMEAYEGVVILATNFRRNMDDAFVRRMHHAVDFPLPGERERLGLWARAFPPQTPLEPGLALERLAARLEVSGGSIRNIALAAAFLAADDAGVVRAGHLASAARRELQKMGKVVHDGEMEALAAG